MSHLDNAATSWPKPSVVYDAVDDYQRRLGVAVGRGGYAAASEVAELVEAARQRIADLIHAGSASQVIFTFNCTDALNLAIHGILRGDDHVVTSTAEHNSVLRPLRWLEDRGIIRVTRVPCDPTGWVDPDGIRAAIRRDTKLIALTHVSNVTGTIQPINDVAQLARELGVLFLLDAAQSLGHIPLSVKDLGVDLLAAAGHKGLLGPLGTGLLYMREGMELLLDSVRQGGTGSASFDDRQPLNLPCKYESGNPNALGLVGLGAGVDFLTKRGLASISQHESALTARLIDGLAEITGVRIHGAPANDRRLGVVSITLADRSSTEVAAILDQEHNIQVRAGYHCAALVHRALGTIEREGTVRFSVGPFNSEQDIGFALDAVREIVCETTQTPQIPVKPPCVAAATLDEGVSSKATDDDVGVSVDQIPGMTELWSHTYGDPEICIAILDSAVDLLHPSLIGKKDLIQKDILSRARSGDLQPTLHGTHIASVIFGQHDSPVRGIAPQCRGLIIPIYPDDGTQISCSKSDLATAIRAAVDEGADVINISGGELLADGAATEDLRAAIQYCCAEKRRLLVAAAGNEGCEECLHVPAALPLVLVAGAMDSQGQPHPSSNYGEIYRIQGVVAPGVNIIGAEPGGGVVTATGTSFATPVVAGVAGLLLSLQRAQGQVPDPLFVREAILRSAEGCGPQDLTVCDRLLGGRLDIHEAESFIFRGVQQMAENIDRRGDAQTPTTPAQGPSAVPQPALQNPVTYYSASPGPGAYQPPYQPPFGPSAPPAGQYGMGPGSGFEVQSITPSGCGCGGQGKGQKVYAIGELGIDFVSETRRDSLQDNFGALPIGDPYNLLGYLLGLTGVNSGNLYDAASIYWVLKQGECPLYVVQPQGSFAEAAYKQLIIFFIEQLVAPEAGKSLADALAKSGISTDCIKWFFPCYGGAQPDLDVKLPLDPSHTARGEKPASQGEYEGKAQKEEEPKPEDGYQSPIISAARALFNEDPSLAAHIAIAGEVTGRARLYSGEEVDVINPAMRGMQNWNTESLITKVMYELTHEPGPEPRKLKPLPPGLMKDRVMSMLFKLVASLYDAILNPGKDPRDRAKNYFATTQLFNATLTLTNPIFLSMLGAFGHRPDHPDAHDTINEQFAFIALDKLVATNARCVRYNTEPYDVELSFYNFANQFMGTAVLAKTVDVSDIVPVAPGDTRVFSRRG